MIDIIIDAVCELIMNAVLINLLICCKFVVEIDFSVNVK